MTLLLARLPRVTVARSLRSKSTAATAMSMPDASNHPDLRHVPSLPVIGSLNEWYSGLPKGGFDPSRTYDFWKGMNEKYGDFYSLGIPGVGAGPRGTVYLLQDPQEMMKVLRSEGKFPTSIVTDQWPVKKVFQNRVTGRVVAILEEGEDWRLVRNFMQKDLLSPQAAKRYIPNIAKACKYISKGIVYRSDDLNKFLNEASFDMFSTVLLGQFPHLTDPDTETSPDDKRFCAAVAESLQTNVKMTRSVWESILGKKFNIETKMYKRLRDCWDTAFEIGNEKIRQLKEKAKEGKLNAYEEASYWNQAQVRRVQEQSELTEEEVDYICFSMLTASVDTTSGKMAWHLLHAGISEEAQEKLYAEVKRIAEECEGEFTEDSLSAANAPYLHAFQRESHRLTNPANLVPVRTVHKEIEIHGITFPTGTVFGFESIAKNNDPSLLDRVDEFVPERWLPNAVQARKGTRAEILDHPLFSEPFGQGARRCPGSRVARNETLVLLSQLLLDWKMSAPGVSSWRDVPYGQQTLVSPFLPKMEFVPR